LRLEDEVRRWNFRLHLEHYAAHAMMPAVGRVSDRYRDDLPDAVLQEKSRVMRSVNEGRCLFITRNGYIGLGPATLRRTDHVCVLFGGTTPFLLRPRADGVGKYSLVGECYCHGVMDGEALEKCRELDIKTFEIY
jgi:hypothetical protein